MQGCQVVSGKHAENFPPSSAARWLKCPGSIALIKAVGIKDEGNIHSQTGTAAHKLLELCLTKGKEPEQYLNRKLEGIEVDQRMVDNIDTAVGIIGTLCITADKWGAETWVDIPCTGEGGTVDAWAATMRTHRKRWVLDVWDYKNGRNPHRPDGPQTKLYAHGLVHKLNKVRPLAADINLHIGPNFHGAEHALVTHQTTSEALIKWGNEHVAPVVKAHNNGTAKCIAGEHCMATRCPAMGRCEAFARKGAAEARLDFGELIKPKATMTRLKPKQAKAAVALMTNEQLANLMRAMSYFQSLATAVERQIMLALVKNPKAFKEWKLVAANTNRFWRDQQEVMKALDKMGIHEDEYLKQSLVGLGEVAKLIPVSKRESFLRKHTTKREGQPTLAPSTDPRAALSNATIDFSDDLED